MDLKYMQRALELAALALGRTCPNPVVGAVIVNDGQIVGEGYHHKAGTPHAEVHALNAAGQEAMGATIYVTLEPCSHYGRTPPCVDAIINAGIRRTVVATVDPNPKVAGQGIQKLKDARISVTTGVLQTECAKLNEAFFKHIQTGLPLVAVKTAMTLDGKIAANSGDSKWITGEAARHHVHQLRNVYDAIMVGIGTVLKDDPLLNTRLNIGNACDPVRIIIDTDLDLPLGSNIVKTAQRQRSLVFCSDEVDTSKTIQLEELGLEIIRMPASSGLIPLERVLETIGHLGMCSLLVEGGGEINGYLLQNRLVDKLYWYIAPKIIGGRTAPSPVGGPGAEYMKDAQMLKSIEIERFDEDILLTGYFKEWWI